MNTSSTAQTITVPLPTLTPDQLAHLFWALDADKQAQFFNALAVEVLATPSAFSHEINSWFPLDWQMYHAAKSSVMLPIGLRAMEIIGQNTSGELLQPYQIERENEIRSKAFIETAKE